MAIPLFYFLLVWLVLIGIFLIMSAITLLMYLRFGLAGSMTFLSTLLFVGVAALMLLATAGYLARVDWTQEVSIGSIMPSSETY